MTQLHLTLHVLSRICCLGIVSAISLLNSPLSFATGDAPKRDPRYAFRTDTANAHLPWYQLRAGEFPPSHSWHRVSGDLLSVDYVHRTGQFRSSTTGDIVDFTLLPYGATRILNAPADLRDVPLAMLLHFDLYRDTSGSFTRLAAMQDSFSIDKGSGHSFTLDAIEVDEGRIRVTKHTVSLPLTDLGKEELRVTTETRVWKGNRQVSLADLAAGDELLFNLTGKTAGDPGRCSDIWVGAETHELAERQQRNKFVEFTRSYGLPGWIDNTDGNTMAITLFSGEPRFDKAYQAEHADSFKLGQDGLSVAVANDELRTWNPAVDAEKARLIEIQEAPAGTGSSGKRLVMIAANMLEGFRKGRIVRVFGAGWKVNDMPYGQRLFLQTAYPRLVPEVLVLPPKEFPEQFPFRTDYGNEHLPWYQLQPGVVPPKFSEHCILGQLVKADAAKRTGQFRADRTGELVDFALTTEGAIVERRTATGSDRVSTAYDEQLAAVLYLDSAADLADIPPGTRCRFHLHQDDRGDFTRASLVMDEYSYLALNHLTYRLEALNLDAGRIHVARQMPPVKNFQGDIEYPPAIGRTELAVHADTRVWKEGRRVRLSDMRVGDDVLVNLRGRTRTDNGHCTDIWVRSDQGSPR